MLDAESGVSIPLGRAGIWVSSRRVSCWSFDFFILQFSVGWREMARHVERKRNLHSLVRQWLRLIATV